MFLPIMMNKFWLLFNSHRSTELVCFDCVEYLFFIIEYLYLLLRPIYAEKQIQYPKEI